MKVTEGLQSSASASSRTGPHLDVDLGRHDHAASALPAAAAASTQSLLQLVRMLARSPVASNNIAVYNDLLRLEEDLQSAAAQYHERMQAEESKPFRRRKSTTSSSRSVRSGRATPDLGRTDPRSKPGGNLWVESRCEKSISEKETV